MISGGIMAGGRGERIKSDISKPLYRVGGRPLIDHLISQYLEAGIARIVVEVRPEQIDVVTHIKLVWSPIVQISIVSAPIDMGSASSVAEILNACEDSALLICPVDTYAPEGTIRRFIREAADHAESALTLLISSPRPTSKQVWATLEDGRVTGLGKNESPATYVFAGARVMGKAVAQRYLALDRQGISQDSERLSWLVKHLRGKTRAVVQEGVFNINNESDAEAAEAWTKGSNA